MAANDLTIDNIDEKVGPLTGELATRILLARNSPLAGYGSALVSMFSHENLSAWIGSAMIGLEAHYGVVSEHDRSEHSSDERNVANPFSVHFTNPKSWRKGGARSSVSVYPDMIAVDHGYFYAAIGEDQPSFVYEIRLSSGRALYHDIFVRHAFAVHAARRRVFVCNYSDGIYWADPMTRRAHRIDDHYHPTIRFRRFENGEERPDAALQSDFRSQNFGFMLELSEDMTDGRSGTALHVAGLGPSDEPVLFIIDVAAAKLIEVLSFGADREASIVGLDTGTDGNVYFTILAPNRRVLSLYRLDGATGKAVGRADVDLGSLGLAGPLETGSLSIGGDRLFLALDTRLVAVALADPTRVLAVADLPIPSGPIGHIFATGNGKKVYFHLDGVVPVSLTEDGRLVMGERLRLAGDPGLMALDRSTSAAR